MPDIAFKPDWAVPPGATLLEWLCERFEEQSGIDVTTLERLIRGETELTDSIAAKLYAATGVPIRLWLNLEKDYRDHLNRKIEEVDAPFVCTYYREDTPRGKFRMAICRSGPPQDDSEENDECQPGTNLTNANTSTESADT